MENVIEKQTDGLVNVVENGLDLAVINPRNGPQFSPNLHRFLKRRGPHGRKSAGSSAMLTMSCGLDHWMMVGCTARGLWACSAMAHGSKCGRICRGACAACRRYPNSGRTTCA